MGKFFHFCLFFRLDSILSTGFSNIVNTPFFVFPLDFLAAVLALIGRSMTRDISIPTTVTIQREPRPQALAKTRRRKMTPIRSILLSHRPSQRDSVCQMASRGETSKVSTTSALIVTRDSKACRDSSTTSIMTYATMNITPPKKSSRSSRITMISCGKRTTKLSVPTKRSTATWKGE